VLKKKGLIKVSGGCEVYEEGIITLQPVDGNILIHVDNQKHFFYADDNHPIPSFSISIPNEVMMPYMERIETIVKSPVPHTEFFNTREAVVTLYLPVTPETIDETWKENEGGYQIDPLLDVIDDMVKKCFELKTPSRKSDNKKSNNVARGNKTEQFFGKEDQRDTAVIYFTDMNGLHGGTNIVIQGNGQVMVLTVAPREVEGKGIILWEKQYTFGLQDIEMQNIFSALIDNNFLNIELEDRQGLPEEIRVNVSVSNSKGSNYVLGAWEKNELLPDQYQKSPRKRFDNVCSAIERIATGIDISDKPYHEGPYAQVP